MKKNANEKHKEKLLSLIESGDVASIKQAISLNETLNIISESEINTTIASQLKGNWESPLWRMVTTSSDWQTFLESFDSDSGPTQDEWTPSNEKEGWATHTDPFGLDGYVAMPKAKRGMSVANYGKLLGKYIVDLEKKVLNWANSRPEITVKELFVWGGKEVLSDGYNDSVVLQISLDVDINLVRYFD